MIKKYGNTLRIFEREIIGKIHGTVKEGEPCRIRTNKEMDILQRQDIVNIYKIPPF